MGHCFWGLLSLAVSLGCLNSAAFSWNLGSTQETVFKVDIEGWNARIPGWRRWGIPSVSSSLSYGEIDTKLSKVVTERRWEHREEPCRNPGPGD